MSNIEKAGIRGLAAFGALSIGAGLGYIAVEAPVFTYNSNIEDASEDVDCVDALRDESGRFIELPGSCTDVSIFTVQEVERDRQEFYSRGPDGAFSRTTDTHELTTFDTIEDIAERVELSLDKAKRAKQEARGRGAIGGAVVGGALFAAAAVMRLRNRPAGKHSLPAGQAKRFKKRVSGLSESGAESKDDSVLTKY